MSRYIDADALIADMQERYCKSCKENGEDYNEVRCRACWVDDAINDADGFADNSIDIEPKRGEWLIEKTLYDNYNYRCSYCDWYECHAYPDVEPYNFCPNCGAKMKGADDESD